MPVCVILIMLCMHMQFSTCWTWLSPPAAEGEMREAPCTRRGQWMTTHSIANETASHQWVIPSWLKVRHSERLRAFICLLTARKSVPCFWFLPWASLGMISTRLIIMSYQYTTWSTLCAFQQVNNTCRISLQKGNIVHYTRYTINDNTVI